MAKAQKYIDDLLRPEMLKYQRQREEIQQEIDRQHITVRELMVCKSRRPRDGHWLPVIVQFAVVVIKIILAGATC